MTDFDIGGFRRRTAEDLRDAAERLRQDVAAGRIWSSRDAGQEEPYRPHRNHGCDPGPSLFWGDLNLIPQPDVAWTFDPARPDGPLLAARRTDEGAYVITTLTTPDDIEDQEDTCPTPTAKA